MKKCFLILISIFSISIFLTNCQTTVSDKSVNDSRDQIYKEMRENQKNKHDTQAEKTIDLDKHIILGLTGNESIDQVESILGKVVQEKLYDMGYPRNGCWTCAMAIRNGQLHRLSKLHNDFFNFLLFDSPMHIDTRIQV